MEKITCSELVLWQQKKDFTLLDVRLKSVKDAQPLSIAGAIWRDPEGIQEWLPLLETDRPVIVFCAHGRSVSQGIATQLAEAGFIAYYLDGGLAAWQEQGHLLIADSK